MNNPKLDRIMVTPEELAKAREILGETAKNMPDNDIINQIIAMKYLSETCLDDFEKSIFDEKTLEEKLSE